MTSTPVRLWQISRYLGPRWLAFRIGYAVRLRSGLLRRRLPGTSWEAQPLARLLTDPALADPARYFEYRRHHSPPFFFRGSDRQRFATRFGAWDGAEACVIRQAEDLAQGNLCYFEHTSLPVGKPPRWLLNPVTGQSAPSDRHWSQIGDFGLGDIKVIWEASRFGFVYALVRAYWRTDDQRYAELFWQLVEDWRAHNPPQQGPNWKCGQETSFRVMAWCFGLYGFQHAPATTPERVAMLAQMIGVSGKRIAANLSYALSQRNNHGISEGLGLWTIGVLFPELRDAAAWRATGRRVLEQQGRTLIYDDGAFVQHSVNYHRLMLHDYLWVLRLGDLHGTPFSAELKDRVRRAGDFLYQIQDEHSGQVPYYGQNDGALILPLSNTDYQDFRPVIQAAHFYATGRRCYASGPWDEDLLWLFGAEALEVPRDQPVRKDLRAEQGGCYTLRAPTSFAFVRCPTFRDRPAQADALHVDLWWQGCNVALDAGTFSYNAPDPWNNSLTNAAYHNTVTVDGLDQMEQASRFLYLPWLKSRQRHDHLSLRGELGYWEGEHDGYQRLHAPVTHRRGVLRLGDGWWIVLDQLESPGDHTYRMHWLLPDLPHQWNESAGQLSLETSAGPYMIAMATSAIYAEYSLVRADEGSPRGWRAPYYMYRQPALSAALLAHGRTVRFWSVFGPKPWQLTVDGATLALKTPAWRSVVVLDNSGAALLRSASLAGDISDRLEID